MFKMMIILLIAMNLSCDADGQGRKGNVTAPMPAASQTDAKVIGPDAVVTEFMKFISSGDKDKANALLESEPNTAKAPSNLSPDKINRVYEKIPRLDWVTVLTERQFRLSKIIEEKTDGEKSEVTAELGTNDLESFRENARFYLKRIDDRWMISDLELLGKPPASSNKN